MKVIVLLSFLCFFAFAARAEQPAQVSPQDRSWLVAAHQTDLAEIRAGRIAAIGAHTTAIRAAGRMLASDHKSLDAKLEDVARQLDLKLPDHPNARQRSVMQRLQRMSGMPFDRTWAHLESDGHIRAIELTSREIHDGSLPAVKQLAAAALPVLKKHLQTLQHALGEIRGN